MEEQTTPVQFVQRSGEPNALIITGAELDETEALMLLRSVVNAEVKNWVPGVSPRMIHRAALILNTDIPSASDDDPDAGINTHLMRCGVCHWLIRVTG